MKYEGDLVFRRIGLQCADRQKKKKRMSLPMRKKEFSGGKKGSYNIRLSVSHQFG
ncbi:conserved hypothetical protein [Neisseria gonorrhoeae DGI2]|nr:hypothetical protein WX61_00005 [Neisseria gonorrhoeae]EFE04133.1 conserved hypothetical protein [Neisseria gonorrhoeae DGI2]